MNIKKDANEREKSQAKALGMTRCAMSGAGMHKGDIRDELFLIDSKYTYAKTQITVKREDIEKIDIESFNYNPPRKSALLISIDGLERVLIGVEDFNEYRELLRKEIDNGN